MDCVGKDKASAFIRGESWALDCPTLPLVPIPHLSPCKVLQWESSADGREGGISSHTVYEENTLRVAEEWNREITKAVWSGSLSEKGTKPKMYLSM